MENTLITLKDYKNFADRLKKVVNFLKYNTEYVNQELISNKIDFSRSNLSAAINGNQKYLTEGLANKIVEAFPELNKFWLLFGEGSMLNTSGNISINGNNHGIANTGTINGNVAGESNNTTNTHHTNSNNTTHHTTTAHNYGYTQEECKENNDTENIRKDQHITLLEDKIKLLEENKGLLLDKIKSLEEKLNEKQQKHS